MTDNEIIKAWEWHTMPINNGGMKIRPVIVECTGDLADATLDLIKRNKAEKEALIAGQETLQKCLAKKNAEVERLTKLALERHIHIYNLNEKIEELRKIRYLEVRAEAIKEFAERLKPKVEYIPWCEYHLVHTEIDNLVKEMVGDKK